MSLEKETKPEPIINLKQINKITLICLKPSEIYLNFLNKFSNYEVYIIIDDNSVNYTVLYQTKYSNLKFIQISEKVCKQNGFINVNKIGVKKLVSGWDKALCFCALNFSNTNENTNTKIWFIEDDVFFHNEDTLLKIDAKYSDYDLLANSEFNPVFDMNTWLWHPYWNIKIKIEKPYYCGMMCATRLSQNVLKRIRVYATLYKELFFLEALIPTLSKSKPNGNPVMLSCYCPDELKTILYRHDYTTEQVSNKDNIYHPVKDILQHSEFRN